MGKSTFLKLCNTYGGYVTTTGHGYDEFVIKNVGSTSGGGINEQNSLIEFFGGRMSPQSFVGTYVGGKKSEVDNFMAYLQGKGNALVSKEFV